MKNTKNLKSTQEFAQEVYKGLTAREKHLSSSFFYDQKGDKLFQEIMDLPEYYLTRAEYNILENHQDQITEIFAAPGGFDLFELGAGDGKKTKILLKAFLSSHIEFTFLPIDISGNALAGLASDLKEDLPKLNVQPMQGTYFGVLEELRTYTRRKKIILFLGSNIGNFTPDTAVSFLQKTRSAMEKEDLLFIGFDMKKEPSVILNAYNDSTGVTAAFNKNILQRINRELGGNFDLDSFIHWPLYNPQTGEAKSYLISNRQQEIFIQDLNLKVPFGKWESIHTEISRKFDEASIIELAESSGLKIAGHFSDEKDYFRNYFFKKL